MGKVIYKKEESITLKEKRSAHDYFGLPAKQVHQSLKEGHNRIQVVSGGALPKESRAQHTKDT